MNDTSSIGSRLRQARTERGLSQEQLAERAGVSAGFVARIEQDRRRPGIATVFRLAAALGTEPSRLLDQRDRLESGSRERGVHAVRDALLSPGELPGLDLDDGGTPQPLAVLGQRAAGAWRLYWRGELADLAAELPELVTDARATERERGAAAAGPLTQAYRLCANLMVHTGNDDLAFTAAMRAARIAVKGDDPVREAAVAATASWVLLHMGRLRQAEKVAAAAAEKIRPSGKAGMAQSCVYGALLLSAAAPAAAAGDAGAVDGYMAEAQVTALRFTEGDRHDYELNFGPTQMAMQAVHQRAVLGQPVPALKAARRVNRADLRRISWGALHLDIAQANLDLKRNGPAVDALWEAWQASAEWARQQGLWRDAVTAAARAERRLSERCRKMAAAAGAR